MSTPAAPKPEKVSPEMQAALPQRRPHGLEAAFGFFSSIPMRPFGVVDRRVARAAIGWAWLMGALLGAACALPGLCVVWAGGSPSLAAALWLGGCALATGAIHLDGLADTADGLGSHKPADEALEIMRRSDIGPMGVVTLLCVLLVEVSALAALTHDWRAFLVGAIGAPAVGRLMLQAATAPDVPMARKKGFGALFGGVTPRWQALLGDACALAVAGGIGWWLNGVRGAIGAPVTILGVVLVAWAWRRHLIRRLGGMTGDTFGSIAELSTSAALVGLSLSL